MATVIVLNPIGSTAVWNVSTMSWNVSEDVFSGNIDALVAQASGIDFASISYGFTGIPEIAVSRSNVEAVISLVNTNKYNIRVYRADDHRATFYQYLDSIPTSSNYSDNGYWETCIFVWDDNDLTYDEYSESKNYKYKASFYASGTRNGVSYELESQTSSPVYTIGDRTL
jgi:hypothetical protein